MNLVDEVSTRTLRLVVAEVERQGDDADAVLAEAELTRAQLADADGRVSHDTAVQIWCAAQTATADPFFGLNVATHQDPRRLDARAYALLHGPTLGEGLRRLVDIHPRRPSHALLEFDRSGDGAIAILRHRRPGGRALPRCIGEWIVATWLRAFREGTGRRLDPSAVRFAHPAPESARHLAELRDTLGVAPTFDAPHHELHLPIEHLALPMAMPNPVP